MKIEGPGPLRPSSNRPSKGSSKSGSSSFADSLGGTGKGAQSVAGGAPITQVDALLSLQEVPDSLERRKRHVKRGFDLLERLEVIRDALLTGQLPLNRLDDLATALRLDACQPDLVLHPTSAGGQTLLQSLVEGDEEMTMFHIADVGSDMVLRARAPARDH